MMLQIPPIPISEFPSASHMGAKLRLLAQHAGLELSAPRLPDLPIEKTAFKLPDETIGTGRLLPTARFLISEIQTLPGDVQEWVRRFYVRFFQHCELPGGLPDVNISEEGRPGMERTLSLGYTAELEVNA